MFLIMNGFRLHEYKAIKELFKVKCVHEREREKEKDWENYPKLFPPVVIRIQSWRILHEGFRALQKGKTGDPSFLFRFKVREIKKKQ